MNGPEPFFLNPAHDGIRMIGIMPWILLLSLLSWGSIWSVEGISGEITGLGQSAVLSEPANLKRRWWLVVFILLLGASPRHPLSNMHKHREVNGRENWKTGIRSKFHELHVGTFAGRGLTQLPAGSR